MFVKCIEQITYSRKDIFVYYYKGLPVFSGNEAGMIQTLEMDSEMITIGIESSDDEKPIILNTTLLCYYIFMLDPIAQFFSDSPQILPQTMLSLKRNHLFVFLKVVNNTVGATIFETLLLLKEDYGANCMYCISMST